jgi:acetyltransferase-like isoleucine patch superfamily enzyme/acyl carrier protein
MSALSRWKQRGRTRRFARACASLGVDPVITGTPTVEAFNSGRIEVGDRFALASEPVPSHMIATGRLRIGNDVRIGHGAAIAATVDVSIGDRTKIGAFFLLMDTDFHGERARVGARPTTNTAMGPDSGYAPVTIGANVRISDHVTILRGSSVGDGAVIEAGTVINGRIPANTRVGGVPARAVSADGRPLAPTNDVAQLVARVFGLSQTPAPDAGPDDIPEWDSLGSLRLLLALEDALGAPLNEEAFAAVRTIEALQAVVDVARRAGEPAAAPVG